MDQIGKKYHQVVLTFGDQDVQIAGTTRITKRDIFVGNSKTENALLFVENLDKVVKTKSSEIVPHLGARKLEALQSESRSIVTGATSDPMSLAQQFMERSAYDSFGEDLVNESQEEEGVKEEVLLNISPKKYEKPKD